MADAAVRAKTGKDWTGWFGVLDRAGGAKLEHRGRVKCLSEKHGVSGWWCQMVTVEYERARGLRERHEKSSGFSVTVSKTILVDLSRLYDATAVTAKRKAWFPKGAFSVSSQTRNKYFRGAWKKTSRLEIGFHSKGPGKSQISIQVNKLARKLDVDVERVAWKKSVEKLARMFAA
jgi:hypothetical protein